MRESIQIARALLSGEPVTYQGERFQVAERRLLSGRCDIPIVLAASRPKMLELAGAEADGVLISAGTSAAFIEWALTHVKAGESRSGRSIQKAALVYAAIGVDGHAARNALRRNLAFILRGEHHAHNLQIAGTRLDQQALTAAFARGDWTTVEALIDDDVVANHTMSGTPAQVTSAMRAYEAVGLDEIVIAGVSGGSALKAMFAALNQDSLSRLA
jgi:5,10-methylenetetrahydromethanopterin reductase